MMVCMAGLQVFIVRFFFQVCITLSCRNRLVLTGYFRARERVTCEGLCLKGHSWEGEGIRNSGQLASKLSLYLYCEPRCQEDMPQSWN